MNLVKPSDVLQSIATTTAPTNEEPIEGMHVFLFCIETFSIAMSLAGDAATLSGGGAASNADALAHLLGGLSNETIDGSVARIDIGTEQLFTVTGLPRAGYKPNIFVANAERKGEIDPVLTALGR